MKKKIWLPILGALLLMSGLAYGQEAEILTSTATLINRIKTPYWQQNSNKDLYLRDSLGL
jgi:hypothetical protein